MYSVEKTALISRYLTFIKSFRITSTKRIRRSCNFGTTYTCVKLFLCNLFGCSSDLCQKQFSLLLQIVVDNHTSNLSNEMRKISFTTWFKSDRFGHLPLGVILLTKNSFLACYTKQQLVI